MRLQIYPRNCPNMYVSIDRRPAVFNQETLKHYACLKLTDAKHGSNIWR